MEQTIGTTKKPVRVSLYHVLGHLSGKYVTLTDKIAECIQNSIDAGSKKIDCVLDLKGRRYNQRDDGKGASESEMDSRLVTVAQPERKGKDAIGQYGIGFFAFFNVCERMAFMSCPKGEARAYREWTFDHREMQACKDDLCVDMRLRPDLQYVSHGSEKNLRGGSVWWRTQIEVTGLTMDRHLSDVESVDAVLKRITDQFRVTMRKHDIRISMRIIYKNGREEVRESVAAPRFNGTKIPEVTLDGGRAGRVIFRLFRTQPKLSEKVHTGELAREHRFPIRMQFAAVQAAGLMPRKEVVDALNSGILEGDILVEKLRMNANRQSYERGDALVDFLATLETWYEKHGKRYVEEAEEQRQDTRYRELAAESLSVFEKALQDKRLAAYTDALGLIRPPRPDPKGEEIVATGEAVMLRPKKPGDAVPEPRRPEKKASAEKTEPSMPTGGTDKPKRAARGKSSGLTFNYEELLDSHRLWKLDLEKGVLYFNARHPLWLECERHDREFMKLQEFITMMALRLCLEPDDWQSRLGSFIDDAIRMYVFLIKNSKAEIPRGRPKKTEQGE